MWPESTEAMCQPASAPLLCDPTAHYYFSEHLRAGNELINHRPHARHCVKRAVVLAVHGVLVVPAVRQETFHVLAHVHDFVEVLSVHLERWIPGNGSGKCSNWSRGSEQPKAISRT
jgi:hypothetical protein